MKAKNLKGAPSLNTMKATSASEGRSNSICLRAHSSTVRSSQNTESWYLEDTVLIAHLAPAGRMQAGPGTWAQLPATGARVGNGQPPLR